MDVLIGWQPYETIFNGSPIKMELRPLRRKAMMLLAPFMELGKETGVKLIVDTFELQGIAAQIFPEHVKDIRGITVNGKSIAWEDLTEEAVFCQLVGDIIGQLAVISSLKDSEAKNSGGPSDTQKPGGQATPELPDNPPIPG